MSQSDWLGHCAQTYPRRVAVIDAGSQRKHTFRSFDQRANQIAHFCEQWVGLMPGDCVGLLSMPSDDILQIVVAAGKLGLTVLMLDPLASSESLVAAINQHGPRTVFYGLPQADMVREIWFEVNSVEHFIPLRGAVDTANFEDIVAHYPPTFATEEAKEGVTWVHFAAEGINWPEPGTAAREYVAGGDRPGPLYQPDGLATAIAALQAGQGVIVERATLEVIESPREIDTPREHEAPSERNVPRGRSWLPHEFR
jgi:acyl-CoA synthetase (AMP-forming)/AMP-acid ligase II